MTRIVGVGKHTRLDLALEKNSEVANANSSGFCLEPTPLPPAFNFMERGP